MNVQRNIFAGLLIFIVFLTIPLYLDFIGVEDVNDFSETDRPLEIKNDGDEKEIKNQNDAKNDLTFNKYNENTNNRVERLITINTNYYSMILSNRAGGSIVFYQLTENRADQTPRYVGSYDQAIYNDSLMVKLIDNPLAERCAPCLGINGEKLNGIFTFNSTEDNIYLKPGESKELIFTYEIGPDEYVEKRIVVDGDGFDFESQYLYKTNKNNVEIVWDGGLLPTEPGDSDVWEGHSAAYIYQNNSLESIAQGDHLDIKPQTFSGDVDWFAIRNKYFGIIVIPEKPMEYAKLASKNSTVFEGREITPIYTAVLGSTVQSQTMQQTNSFTTYIGPLDLDHIQRLDSSVESIMNFGWSIIKPFSKMILWIVKSLHNTLGLNYGFVLIIIAIMMRFIMGPLTRKSAESSVKMQEVAPLQKKLQEKYKNNPQQLQKEMGELWKKHGVNPISGCLPMLLQWPVLMSFFIVFRSTIEFRGEPFVFWITDLSQPDYLFNLPFHIPMYGSAVAVLPIIMGISMFLTMSVTMQDKSQKPMMYFMNTFFILIFNSFPSGLTLYYTVFNFLSYQQQLSIKKNK